MIINIRSLDVRGVLAGGDAEDAGFSRDGDWVVEIDVLIVPLNTEVVLARVLEGGVDRSEVLTTAHR
jgi:hypothetical protein